MREIKFRAWDKAAKTMAYSYRDLQRLCAVCNRIDCTTLKDNEDLPIAFGYKCNRINLLQYTGLKDKNGKEIYEGDIVKVYPAFPDGDIQKVHWNDFIQGFAYGGYALPQIGFKESFEVIGNIYENPELLIKKEGGQLTK